MCTTRRTWARPPRRGIGGTATTRTRSWGPRWPATRPPARANIGQIQVADQNHLATSGLPDQYGFGDEHYNFRRNVRGSHHVLATIDERTYTPGGNAMGQDHPITWCKLYDGDNVNDNTGTRQVLPGRSHVGDVDGSLRLFLHRERWRQQHGQADRRRRPLGRRRGPEVRLLGHGVVELHPSGPGLGRHQPDRHRRGQGRQGLLVGDRQHDRLPVPGLHQDARPQGPANNKTTVGTILTRADHGYSEDGVLGM